jgi:hypothetical protein
MAAAIRFALSNFTLTLLVLGVVAALASLVRAPKLTAPRVVEALLFYFLMFSIGFQLLVQLCAAHILWCDGSALHWLVG